MNGSRSSYGELKQEREQNWDLISFGLLICIITMDYLGSSESNEIGEEGEREYAEYSVCNINLLMMLQIFFYN